MRQVGAGEIVQGAVQECLCQSFRRRDAEAVGHALHADPVQGAGAPEGQVKSPITGIVVVTSERTGATEVGAKALSEFAGQFEIVVTGEGEAQVEMGAEDDADGVAELTGEIERGVEVATEGEGVEVTDGKVAAEGEDEGRVP